MTWPGPSSDDDLPPLEVHVPDDARELDADVLAYLREQREAARAGRRRRLSAWLRRHAVGRVLTGRRGISLAVLTVATLMAAASAAGLALLGPRPAPRPPAAALASEPTAAPGDVGGLLPATPVVGPGGTQPARELRPAVLAFVGPDCGCAATLQAVHRQAAEFTLRMFVVARPEDVTAVRDLATDARLGQVTTLVDRNGGLTGTYGDGGPTYVLVHADGVVREILTDVTPSDRLELHLAPLSEPGARG